MPGDLRRPPLTRIIGNYPRGRAFLRVARVPRGLSIRVVNPVLHKLGEPCDTMIRRMKVTAKK